MNVNMYNHWFDKYSGIDPGSKDRVRNIFSKVPGMDRILEKAVKQKLDLAGMKELVESRIEPVNQTPAMRPDVEVVKTQKPSFLKKIQIPSLINRKRKFAESREDVGVEEDYSDDEIEKPRFSFGSLFSNRKLLIGIGAGLIVLVLIFVFAGSYLGQSPATQDITFTVDPMIVQADTVIEVSDVVGVEEVENPPVLINPKPLDFKSSGWLKPLQLLILVETLGVIASMLGDAFFRKQWTDALVAILIALVTIFVVVPDAVPVYFAGLWFLSLIAIVFIVSFMGGRDLSPASGYFLLVGIIGGLLTRNISAVQGMTNIVPSQVLPMSQIGVSIQLMDWKSVGFPLVVYLFIILGTIFALFEAFRPSEDKTPRWGTVLAAGIGLAAYFPLLHFTNLAPWLAYLVAFSLSIAISAMTQNERAIRVITDRWGVRSAFDGAILLTAVLLMVHIIFGTVG